MAKLKMTHRREVRQELLREADLLSGFEAEITTAMIRDLVGRAMFCSQCEEILDSANAVVWDNREKGASSVLCGGCSDALERRLPTSVLEPVELIDGRDLSTKPAIARDGGEQLALPEVK